MGEKDSSKLKDKKNLGELGSKLNSMFEDTANDIEQDDGFILPKKQPKKSRAKLSFLEEPVEEVDLEPVEETTDIKEKAISKGVDIEDIYNPDEDGDDSNNNGNNNKRETVKSIDTNFNINDVSRDSDASNLSGLNDHDEEEKELESIEESKQTINQANKESKKKLELFDEIEDDDLFEKPEESKKVSFTDKSRKMFGEDNEIGEVNDDDLNNLDFDLFDKDKQPILPDYAAEIQKKKEEKQQATEQFENARKSDNKIHVKENDIEVPDFLKEAEEEEKEAKSLGDLLDPKSDENKDEGEGSDSEKDKEKEELLQVSEDGNTLTDSKGRKFVKEEIKEEISDKNDKIKHEAVDKAEDPYVNIEQPNADNQKGEVSPETQKIIDETNNFDKKFSDLNKRLDEIDKENQKNKEELDQFNEIKAHQEEINATAEEKDRIMQESIGSINENEPEITEETKAEEKKEEQEVNKEGQELESTASNVSPNAIEAMNYQMGIYNAATGQNVDASRFNAYTTSLSSLTKLPKELQLNAFNKAYADIYKQELTNALKANERQKANGKPAGSITETTKQADSMMNAYYNYLKDVGVLDKNSKQPMLGGVSAEEIRDIQTKALSTNPNVKQNAEEKKEIDQQFKNNKLLQNNEIKDNFSKHITNLNKAEGVHFDAKGIEVYLASRWKASASNSLDEQREKFQKEYKAFAAEAYKKMAGTGNFYASQDIRLSNFDKFTQQIETLAKNNGWMDKNEPHSLYGGLDPKDMSKMAKQGFSNQPKSLEENTTNLLKGLKNIKDLNDLTNNLKNRIPPAAEGKMDNIAARQAVSYINALNKRAATRPKNWSKSHPAQAAAEKNAIQSITSELESKGYKDVMEYYNKNPLKPENDPVTQNYNRQMKDMNNIPAKTDQLNKAEIEFKNEQSKQNLGVRIEVPEANNLNEIVKPDIKSPKIEVQKTVDLSIQGPSTGGGKK